jgi:hypothetical protein
MNFVQNKFIINIGVLNVQRFKDKLSVCKYFAYKGHDVLLYLMIKNNFPYDDELISILIKNNLKTALSYMSEKGLIKI